MLTLLALGLLILFLSLANWQLNRAAVKQSLLDQQARRMGQARVDLAVDRGGLRDRRYLPVRVAGIADTAHQILLDNQIYQGRAGYLVLLPVQLDTGGAVLLNRGWLVGDGDRSQLPTVAMDAAHIEVSAYLDEFPSVGLQLSGADIPASGWPSVIQVVDVEQLSRRLGYTLLPYQAVLEPGQAYGYQAMPRALPMGPEKHYGYALQWGALALALVVIYAVLTVRRHRGDDRN